MKYNLKFYKTYIDKNISIYGKQWKVTDVRSMDDGTILMYYKVLDSIGIANAAIVKDSITGKFLDDMGKEDEKRINSKTS